MTHFVKKLLLFVAVSTLTHPAYAVDLSSYSLLDKRLDNKSLRGSEYVSGAQPGRVLMRVNIWGAVGKPGIHHVPSKTNLLNLISYAGGPKRDAILDEVIIKRQTATSQKRIRVDLEEIIYGKSLENVALEPNDIIVVPIDKPIVENDTALLVGIIGTLFSVVATGLLISDRRRD